ncbi:ABC transporter permease [Asticcacaulis machinosus]|uniref:MlaE family lipid ABC transporter permease subunit n=1 Tax=Asticcacaulis machinosus TaxID=2984211 RepID=A0ABT5HEN0_9CAUL|nr:MlaE family lipid ABC transporter permease subunit [Asticcacaulis machinosus]MDC7674531.1 MlaE family lipid ABC transporter permease subunit [Asticcacaulis machinosus]
MAKTRTDKAQYRIEPVGEPEGSGRLTLSGDWRIGTIGGLAPRLKSDLKPFDAIEIDSSGLEQLDTAGAYLLSAVIGSRLSGDVFAGQDNFRGLYDLVSGRDLTVDEFHEDHVRREDSQNPIVRGMAKLGVGVVANLTIFSALLAFIGHTVVTLIATIFNPWRLRLTPLVSLMQRAGIEALPIVIASNLFIGAVIAFLGAMQLRQFGAQVFSIELVGIAELRELGPLITAVLLAGRSASSFAAEIGAMKMNQEIDAMRVMGIDPYEALVLPRLIGLVLMIPLITFVGSMAGMIGGFSIIWTTLDYGPPMIIQRTLDYVDISHFFVGMVKTPFYAAAIAIIGCHMGMTVTEDVISLGRQVTRAVVQAIFAIFVIDAVFALLFQGVPAV